MSLLSVCVKYGGVQPSEFDAMDPDVAAELARRLIDLRRDEIEQDMKFHTELTKAVMKSNGAKVG